MQRQPNLITSFLFALVFLASASFAYASTTNGTIDSTYKYGWSNAGGFVNFAPTNGGLAITDSTITGYAWAANTGWINFDTAQSGVTNNGEGTLAGFAWSTGEGWLSFTGVTIDSNGKFHGTATGANSTLTFDCTNCDVRTDWRPASARPSTGGSGGGGGGIIHNEQTATTTLPNTIPPATPGSPAMPPGANSSETNAGNGTSTNTALHAGTSVPTTATTHPATSTASSASSFWKPWFVPAGIFLLLIIGFVLFRFFFRRI